MKTYEKMLVPTDFSAHSLAAGKVARDLAEKLGARLILLHVIDDRYVEIGMGHLVEDPAHETSRLRKIADERMAEFVKRVGFEAGQVTTYVREGVPHKEILAQIEAVEPDIVVMGTHGRTGVQRAVLGSQSELVVRRCAVPVLVVHAEEPQAEA